MSGRPSANVKLMPRPLLRLLARLHRQRRASRRARRAAPLQSGEISAPIRPTQALIVVVGLAITLAANALLLRRALAPLERLAQRMETVDLLRPGQRLQVSATTRSGVSSPLSTACSTGSRRAPAERPARPGRAGGGARRHRSRPPRRGRPGADRRAAAARLDRRARSAHRDEIDEAKQAVRRALDEVRRISQRAAPGDARASRARQRADRADDDVQPRLRHPRRAPSSTSPAQARARSRARRLPDRAGEPDERRTPRAGAAE